MRRIADALGRVRHDYVDALEEGFLAERCLGAMDKQLGADAPKLAGGARPSGDRIGEYWRALAAREPDTAKLDKTADACLHGMVDNLDRRTEYMDREKFRELLVGSTGAAGIGLEMELVDGVATVVEPIEGAPAERAGLKAGDRLLEVDGVPTAGKKLDEVAKLLRGKRGSTVALSLSRDGAPMRREVVRDTIRVSSVKWRLLEGRFLYVRASQFAERTLEEFRQALEKGRAEAGAAYAGTVLDLRGNPGGLFHSCIGLSATFLPETAAVVETKGRGEDTNRRLFARPADYERGSGAFGPRPGKVAPEVRDGPLAVIVNKGSAACSEIVAAAMQDHQRAKVIGEKTFGLGTVQTIIPFGNSSALRLTTARFFRPNGAAIEEKGVSPDVPLSFPARFRQYGGPEDPALPAALKALQK